MDTEKDKSMENEEYFNEVLIKIRNFFFYFKKKWWKLLLVTMVGGLIGYAYVYYFKPKTYTTKLSFILEEGKSAGGFSSLAGQFGFDLGTNNAGLLSGDNILMFLKSKSLVKETMLTPYDSSKNLSLADRYAEIYELKKNWLKNKKISNPVFFPVKTNKPFSRQQDSLLNTIIIRIIKGELLIERPEKKATFVTVQTSQRDELLCKLFCERLVQNATDRYVQLKTKRQQANVEKLQKRADSIASVLNNKTYSTASQQEKLLDLNPASKTSTVNSEITGRDKIMLSTIYSEVVKNLEIAKVQLTQETPTIQIIDKPEFPLTVVKKSKVLFAIIISFAFFFIMSIFYAFKFLILNNR